MKKAPTESQMIKLAEKEIALKEQIMNMLATNMKTMTDTMMSAFLMLQYSLQTPPLSNSHYGQYPYVPSSPALDLRSRCAAVPNPSDSSAVFSQTLFDDEY